MVFGLISKTTILGGSSGGVGDVGSSGSVTVTVTDCVMLPALLLTVNVYVVVELGETDTVPAAANPLPTPWSICVLVAFVAFHTRVVDSPSVISVELAENATMVGASVVVVSVGVDTQVSDPSARLLIRTISHANENSLFIFTS